MIFIDYFRAVIGAALRVQAQPRFVNAQRHRVRATKRGMRHVVNPAGTKLERKAGKGTISYRHP